MATQVATQRQQPSQAQQSASSSSATRGSSRSRRSHRGRGRGGQNGAQGQLRPDAAGGEHAEAVADERAASSARQGGGRGGRGGGRGGRGGSRGGAQNGAGAGAPRPAGQGRRARFDATLSSSSASLHASAAPFVPPSSSSAPVSGTSTPPAPAPVNQTLVERLTAEISSGEAECTVCFDTISRTARIYSCTECHMPFHLSCINKWASTAVSASAERAQLLASRQTDSRNPPDPASLEGHWACPNCNTNFKPADVPSKYFCFCRRYVDPHPRPPAIPHSCGKPCAKPRPSGCRHPCSLSCHPGPCPPCPVVLNEKCHCGRRTLGLRCSALHDGKKDTEERRAEKEALKSCGETHDALLSCGLHRCVKSCHCGECGECEAVRMKRCFCGRNETEGLCGATRPDERIDGCRMPGDSAQEIWTGEFACSSRCNALFDCGSHRCEEACHPHTSTTPPHCPFSPDVVTTCPCGQTSLSTLLRSPRSSCTDRIPTCPKTCSKTLDCGHACRQTCHDGPCPPCRETVPLVCRCGSTKTTRLCGEPYLATRVDSDSGEVVTTDEFLCARVCKAQKWCGRHQCGRTCCPLAYQEALMAGKGKGKKRAVTLQESFAEQEAQDPLGLHLCDRVCGRKLNCGIHNCELKDHRGACPPCLRADFDELVCNCGSTVVLPPIPCNFVIDCRHPCIRPYDCGHPRLPHACHEDPQCPPCPYLTVKRCACGKREVPNVRCATDEKKVSCGMVCGKLLRCGGHRCRKSCHPPGECEAVDDQVCLKPRKHCGHPCPLPCHFPSACPADTSCPKLIPVHCACGHITQNARCGACDDKPEGNEGRLLKCTDACAVAKRNAQLAEALGVEKREVKTREVEYSPDLLSFFAANQAWAQQIESQLVEFVQGDKPSLHFPVMKRPQRVFIHELTDHYDLRSESLDEEPRRSVVAHRTSTTGIPSPTLAEALAATKKPASATLSLGSLRRALPEKRKENAIYLEGVLGYDEEMLSDILRPHMRGLSFTLTWVTDEDVLVSFDAPVVDLDTKLASVASALRTVIADTGFCASAEAVHVGDDGRIARGSWTPVLGSSSTLMSAKGSSTGSANAWRMPLKTGNSFASLSAGNSPPRAPQPVANAWGSVIGNGHAKPPRAVVAPRGEEERALPSLSAPTSSVPSRIPTPSLPPPPPVAKKDEDVPDEWDADVE
ncbi:FKBP12-associated protein [Rhodotorula toruloides]